MTNLRLAAQDEKAYAERALRTRRPNRAQRKAGSTDSTRVSVRDQRNGRPYIFGEEKW